MPDTSFLEEAVSANARAEEEQLSLVEDFLDPTVEAKWRYDPNLGGRGEMALRSELKVLDSAGNTRLKIGRPSTRRG
ncbi:hypothetical protein BV898_09975 [Hypsibius exemplaris]|uniref:Uncharacterized protein n=1 Tax=Hypsibius exemplaris TaxID=2072580 RepID=A0A1W0WL25_HYPEX|nr:hypothetical protein BV898_09975 [Hypsibius exemplaris]